MATVMCSRHQPLIRFTLTYTARLTALSHRPPPRSHRGQPCNLPTTAAFFPNNIEIAAWIDDPAGGSALGTTLFVQQNRPACSYGARTFNLDMVSTVPSTIKVKAVVGADNPQDSDFLNFAIDTGSLGVVVSKNALHFGSNVHGPGAQGLSFKSRSKFAK